MRNWFGSRWQWGPIAARSACAAALSLFLSFATAAVAKPVVVVMIGASGEAAFESQFKDWAAHWQNAAKKADAEFQLVGDADDSKSSDHDRLHDTLVSARVEHADPLWVVLIGHGTFDGQSAKFNLRGDDLAAEELAEWLKPVERPTAVINCSAASAPFLNRLAHENRVIITSTKSGDEQNFSYFGQFIAAAIDDARADVDKDGEVSLLEAYLTACRDLEEYYKQSARLATEHPLLDDNGDGLGTPAAWFRGVRATQRAKDGAELDGARAHQFYLIASDREKQLPPEVRKQRDELELKLAKLRDQKGSLKEDVYYQQLEKILLKLAQLYEANGAHDSKPAQRTEPKAGG